MTDSLAPAPVTSSSSPKAVILWRPDSDDSEVLPGIDQAAAFLKQTPDAVRTAIEAGDLIAGWFVDWQAVKTG